jgi:uncharacterized membrane protein
MGGIDLSCRKLSCQNQETFLTIHAFAFNCVLTSRIGQYMTFAAECCINTLSMHRKRMPSATFTDLVGALILFKNQYNLAPKKLGQY